MKKTAPVPNQKLKVYKEQLQAEVNRAIPTYNTYLDKDSLNTMFKIAGELLDSMKSTSDEDPGFHSTTAEQTLKTTPESGLMRSNSSSSDMDGDGLKDTDEAKAQFKLLTGDQANYKKALQYVANVMNFKVTYQSVKMVSPSVRPSQPICLIILFY